ncbi:hypothetical protein JHK85_013326 [Glycine max]|nr:hypothetical protein JHK85_013326 [Glycine max]KAG5057990.1 hypothetical protein JHK86_012986 [Glycine max]KAH1134392.1 hypothetical protein GYH30_012667 [Glycine max]
MSFEQPQPTRAQAQENNEHPQEITNELVLDGDFPLCKSPSHDEFIVPDIVLSCLHSIAKKMREEYGKLNRVEMGILECCEMLLIKLWMPGILIEKNLKFNMSCRQLKLLERTTLMKIGCI